MSSASPGERQSQCKAQRSVEVRSTARSDDAAHPSTSPRRRVTCFVLLPS
jgi:hypothetical protein